MENLQWLFNATRQPGVVCDSSRQHPDHDHVVVLKNNELFEIKLRKKWRNASVQDASVQELEAIFDAIIARFERLDDGNLCSSPAALTSDRRHPWAKVSTNDLSSSISIAKAKHSRGLSSNASRGTQPV